MGENTPNGTKEESAAEGLKVRRKAEEAETPSTEATETAPETTQAAPEAPAATSEAPEGDSEQGFSPSQLSRRVVDPKEGGPAKREETKPPESLRTFDDDATTSDFATLFEEGGAKAPERRMFEMGDKVTAPVTHVDSRFVYVDLGGRGEARAPRGQYENEEGELEVTEGESYEFTVLRFTSEGIEIGKRLDLRSQGVSALEDAQAAGVPLQGRVTGRNKGGFTVDVAGVEAFCPVSQIDLHNAEDLDVYLNETFQFLVMEVRDGGRSVVVSRAAIMREEAAKRRAETMAKLKPGEITTGVIRSLSNFGAFVNLGGVDGLVHISELSWGSVDKPSDVVKEGQTVEVKILDISQREGERSPRISLSMKQAQEDPWADIGETVHVGKTIKGTVTRLAPFGAFVEIKPGVDGLVHVSEMSWDHVRRPADVASVGDSVEVEVLDVDLARQRIGLSMKSASGDPWSNVAGEYPVGDSVEGTVEKIEDFGVFISLGEGITALLPRSEMELGRDETPHTKARAGQAITARVLRVEPERRRMALTLRQGDLSEASERSGGGGGGGDGRRPPRSNDDRGRGGRRDRNDRGSSGGNRSYNDAQGGVGTLGDLLKFKRDED